MTKFLSPTVAALLLLHAAPAAAQQQPQQPASMATKDFNKSFGKNNPQNMTDSISKGGTVDPMEALKKAKETGALPQGNDLGKRPGPQPSVAPVKTPSPKPTATWVNKVPDNSSPAKKACMQKCDEGYEKAKGPCDAIKYDNIERANCLNLAVSTARSCSSACPAK